MAVPFSLLQPAFYGANYNQLYSLKQKHDPWDCLLRGQLLAPWIGRFRSSALLVELPMDIMSCLLLALLQYTANGK